MIEWMQKHRKWLVVTIWISTISFIAAGMVGWGSYSFGLNEGVVAEVGRIKITQNQLQNRYQQLYLQYDSSGNLDAKKADELGLEKIALNNLIEQALLKNLALDLGIRVTNNEVLDEITHLDYFQKDGKFDPITYKNILSQNRIKPSEFEEDVSNDLLIKKVANILPLDNSTLLERKTFAFPFLIEDEIQIKVIDFSKLEISPTQEQIKVFWEQNKTLFQNPVEYKIRYVLVGIDSQKPTSKQIEDLYQSNKGKYLDSNGNIQQLYQIRDKVIEEQKFLMAEDEALKEYISLKKSGNSYGKERNLFAGDKSFGVEVLESLEKGQVGEVFKPIRVSSGFLTFKIVEKIPQMVKTFEEAKNEAREELLRKLVNKTAEEMAQKYLKEGFKGKNIGYLKRDAVFEGLTSEESKLLGEKIFTSSEKRGYLKLDQKIIVFEVLNQRIDASKEESMDQDIAGILELYKSQIVTKEFYRYLQNKYKIVIFK